MLAPSDFVLHAAGWLEGGLTASYEKLALDLEVLRMFEVLERGVSLGEEDFALDAIRGEGPGGMFLAADHTLAHFRDWVFMSPLFRSQSYVTWEKQGSLTTDRAATAEWKRLLEAWEDPGMDESLEAELREHIERRTAELDAE
jgi:trimethylamine---corrinoid protein Co-methyltransferase